MANHSSANPRSTFGRYFVQGTVGLLGSGIIMIPSILDAYETIITKRNDPEYGQRNIDEVYSVYDQSDLFTGLLPWVCVWLLTIFLVAIEKRFDDPVVLALFAMGLPGIFIGWCNIVQ